MGFIPDAPAAAGKFVPDAPAAPAGPAPSIMGRILDAIHPIVSGVNSGAADIAGLPMTAATAATNTVKGPLDYIKDKLGVAHGGAIDEADVPGSATWLKNKAEQYFPGSMNDANHPIQHMIGELVGPGGGAGAAATLGEKLPEISGVARAVETDPLATAGASGFTATPSGAALRNPTQQPGIIPRIVEGIGGTEGATANTNAANTANATKLAGQQMGLGDNVTKITPPDLLKAKAAPGAVYDATGAKLEKFQPSPNLLNQLRDASTDQSVQASPAARTNASKILASIDTNGGYSGQDIVGDISKLRESPNTRPIAVMLDQEIERQLQAKGDGPGLQKLRDARQKFAQIYTVQDSLNGGQVDPQTIGAVHQANPNLLTGNVRLIGSAAQELPADVKLPTQAAPHGALDAILDLARNGTGAGPLARKLMASRTWQNMFGAGPEADDAAKSYFPKYGEKPPAGDAPLTLSQPAGQVGRVMPSVGSPRGAQGELPVPQNPRPLIDLMKPPGTVGELTPVQGDLRVPGTQDPVHNGEPLPPGPGSISGAPMASRDASDLIRPLGEAFQPHQKELFPPNNVSKPKAEPKGGKPSGISDSDWKLLTSLGLGE